MFDKVSFARGASLHQPARHGAFGVSWALFAWCLWRVKTNMAWQTGLAKPTKKAALTLLRNL
jgi:hypothetical protein